MRWWCSGHCNITISRGPGFDPRERQEKKLFLWILLFVHAVHLLSFLRRSNPFRGITSPWRAILGWSKATFFLIHITFWKITISRNYCRMLTETNFNLQETKLQSHPNVFAIVFVFEKAWKIVLTTENASTAVLCNLSIQNMDFFDRWRLFLGHFS